MQKCGSPFKLLPVSASRGEPVSLLWSDFTGGTPIATVDPSQIVGFLWNFERVEWAGTVTPPYPVNVSVGSIRLLP